MPVYNAKSAKPATSYFSTFREHGKVVGTGVPPKGWRQHPSCLKPSKKVASEVKSAWLDRFAAQSAAKAHVVPPPGPKPEAEQPNSQ
ncbi:hypothetical protein MN608_00657 [Microdochium nivale]|nr:hypothetical protein MN608_00657 [Microdochium nivale]